MIGTILYLIAIALFIPLALINFFVVLTVYGWNLKNAGGYFKSLALDIDIMGNRAFRTQNKNYYMFGKVGETISSAIGKIKSEELYQWQANALLGCWIG